MICDNSLLFLGHSVYVYSHRSPKYKPSICRYIPLQYCKLGEAVICIVTGASCKKRSTNV